MNKSLQVDKGRSQRDLREQRQSPFFAIERAKSPVVERVTWKGMVGGHGGLRMSSLQPNGMESCQQSVGLGEHSKP